MLVAEMVEQIVAALPSADAEPIPFREVHRRVDCWAPMTIRNALQIMSSEGLVGSILVDDGKRSVRLWRKPASPTPCSV